MFETHCTQENIHLVLLRFFANAVSFVTDSEEATALGFYLLIALDGAL